MNHDFIPNPNNSIKCIECGYPEDKHGDNAECDCCSQHGNLQIFGKDNQQMLLTRDCVAREKAIIEAEINDPKSERRKQFDEYQSPENQEKRLEIHNGITQPYDRLIGEARKIDEQLHLSSDIFTAKTIPIEAVRKAIWMNDDIPADRKFFEYVAECKRRISHLQSVIFDLDKQKIEAYSEQKAWHISMNDYANKLRADEREQLRISDVHYDVKLPKTVSPRTIKLSDKKATKAELRKAVSELNSELVGSGKDGIAEFTVQMVMTSKNWTLDQTINHLRKTLKEGLSESTKE